MIRHARKADRAEIDGVEPAKLLESVVRHHAAGPGVDLAAPVEQRPLEIETESTPGRLEHAHAFGNHFPADSVAGNHGNPMNHL